MYLADEILKLLVCEICFENYNEQDRLPLAIFPCGHSFCKYCISNFKSKCCPACNCMYDSTAKNWALINLIPKSKIPEVYDHVKNLVNNTLTLLNQFDRINREKDEDNRKKFDDIREKINRKSDELINKIKHWQDVILDRLDKYEEEWSDNYAHNMSLGDNINHNMTQANDKLRSEQYKSDEVKLNEIKQFAEQSQNTLNENLNSNYANKTLVFRNSSFDLEGDHINDEYIFGELVVVDNEFNINSTITTSTANNNNTNSNNLNTSSHQIPITATSKPLVTKIYEFETYSEIESIVKILIIQKKYPFS